MDGGTEGRAGAAERLFDPSRVPNSDSMRALVGHVCSDLLRYESAKRQRSRDRRAEDQRRFEAQVCALVCDLAHYDIQDRREWMRVSLSKERLGRRNVGPEFMTESFRTVIEYMAAPETNWIELDKGVKSPFGPPRQSMIRASERLRERAHYYNIELRDVGRDPALLGDPVVLRSEKVKGKATDLDVPAGEPADSYRVQMQAINAWLARADIALKRGSYASEDINDRWLRRIFNNGSFEQGGRLFGGFWADMSAQRRLESIYIDREPVVSLDFGQCAVRIAYGRCGAAPPAGDLYQVPRLERYREGVKLVLNAMFFSSEPLKRKPRESAKKLPKNYTIAEIQDRIRDYHQSIRELFHVGFGMTSQFIESQILVRCLLALIDRGVVALPIHDCIVVPRSKVAVAEEVMLVSFLEVAGIEGKVERKALNNGPDLPSADEDF